MPSADLMVQGDKLLTSIKNDLNDIWDGMPERDKQLLVSTASEMAKTTARMLKSKEDEITKRRFQILKATFMNLEEKYRERAMKATFKRIGERAMQIGKGLLEAAL